MTPRRVWIRPCGLRPAGVVVVAASLRDAEAVVAVVNDPGGPVVEFVRRVVAGVVVDEVDADLIGLLVRIGVRDVVLVGDVADRVRFAFAAAGVRSVVLRAEGAGVEDALDGFEGEERAIVLADLLFDAYGRGRR